MWPGLTGHRNESAQSFAGGVAVNIRKSGHSVKDLYILYQRFTRNLSLVIASFSQKSDAVRDSAQFRI
jgi:hypothetical protein